MRLQIVNDYPQVYLCDPITKRLSLMKTMKFPSRFLHFLNFWQAAARPCGGRSRRLTLVYNDRITEVKKDLQDHLDLHSSSTVPQDHGVKKWRPCSIRAPRSCRECRKQSCALQACRLEPAPARAARAHGPLGSSPGRKEQAGETSGTRMPFTNGTWAVLINDELLFNIITITNNCLILYLFLFSTVLLYLLQPQMQAAETLVYACLVHTAVMFQHCSSL